MLELCDCPITDEEADRLVAALGASRRASSQETAAAIKWGANLELASPRLEPDIRQALLDALADIDRTARLDQLRATLLKDARTTPWQQRLLRRLHNPRLRSCECLSHCWCQRTTWGNALRWYIPSRYHSSLSARDTYEA